MKRNTLLFILSLLIACYCFMSSSGGRAAAANQGNIGAPGESGTTCATCHNGGFGTLNESLQIRDAANNLVSVYNPGETYNVSLTLTTSMGTPGGYGFQMTALGAGNNDAGTWQNLGANVQQATVTTLNRTYVEHDGTSASNVFSMQWTAPATGTGNVNFYYAGNAVNSNGSTSGDRGGPGAVLSLNEGDPCAGVPPTNGTETYTGCMGDGFSIMVNGTMYNEANPMGTELLAGAAASGCDSLVTVNLVFNAGETDTESYVGCEGDGFGMMVNGTMYNETNPTGTEVISGGAANGCDRVVTVNFVYNAAETAMETHNGCLGDGYSVMVNGTLYNEANPTGTEVISGGAANGCDRIVTIDLAFNETESAMETHEGCMGDGYSVMVNGTEYNESNPTGTEVIVGGGASGCDLTVTIDLVFNAPETGTETYVGCSGDGFAVEVNGTMYNEANPTGTEVISGGATNGCDLTVTVDLVFSPAMALSSDVTGSSGSDGSIDLEVTGGTMPYSYDWSNNETTEDLSGLAPGNYTVTVRDANDCEAIDTYTVIDLVALDDLENLTSFKTFPNPAVSELNVSLEFTERQDFSIELVNIIGETVSSSMHYDVLGGSFTIPVEAFSAGIYFVRITSSNQEKQAVKRILIN